VQALINEALKEEDYMAAAVYRSMVDPDWFASEIINMPNDKWQSELMNAIADIHRAQFNIPTLYNHNLLNRFSIAAFHGPGKTHVMAKIAHWWNFIHKGRIACTAPKLEQLKTRLWPEMRKQRMSAMPFYKGIMSIDRTMIRWFGDEDWCMIAESAAQPDNLAGHHDDHMLFLVDEASGVDEIMWPAIEGALSTHGAVLVIIGNPIRTTGEFWASHNKRGTKEAYYQIKIKPEDSPRISKQWVKDMVRKYGRNSPIVKCRVFGEFIDMEEGQLLNPNWIEKQRLLEARDEDGSIPKLRISADIADGGIDETIFHAGLHYESYVVSIKQIRKSYNTETAVIDAADDLEVMFEGLGGRKDQDEFVVDSLGVGAGTAQELIKRGYLVVKYKGGEQSSQPKRWRCKRVQSYMVSRDAVRDGLHFFGHNFCEDDDWEDFLAQCCSVKQKYSSDRIEDLMTKKEMKAEGIKSPDMADAWVMQYATKAAVGAQTIEIDTFGDMGSYA